MNTTIQHTNQVQWQCPSNIALIKYWGKYGVQLPQNPSISFSLKNSYTDTRIEYIKKHNEAISFDFYLDNHHKPDFEPKIRLFFERIAAQMPFLYQYHLNIYSTNSFPHSAGIASSASAMGALALGLCSINARLNNTDENSDAFFAKASHIARLGSGSAARSVYGGYTLWGQTNGLNNSSQEKAIDINHQIHPDFQHIHDAILLVSNQKKKISSRQGHALMTNHPYAAARYQQAKQNTKELLEVLQVGNTHAFVELVEYEALNLHGLMLSSRPAFTLLQPNSLAIIEKIRAFREKNNLPVSFTIDAGPNIHLLYAEKDREAVLTFIQHQLLQHCEKQQWIDDKIGQGPIRVL